MPLLTTAEEDDIQAEFEAEMTSTCKVQRRPTATGNYADVPGMGAVPYYVVVPTLFEDPFARLETGTGTGRRADRVIHVPAGTDIRVADKLIDNATPSVKYLAEDVASDESRPSVLRIQAELTP